MGPSGVDGSLWLASCKEVPSTSPCALQKKDDHISAQVGCFSIVLDAAKDVSDMCSQSNLYHLDEPIGGFLATTYVDTLGEDTAVKELRFFSISPFTSLDRSWKSETQLAHLD